jgi:hypothetical protein
MLRLIDQDGPRAALITHAHNQLVWSQSHGQPLTPTGYRDLFETLEPRLFGESALLDDVVAGGPLDLSRQDDLATLEADHALTIVATDRPEIFRKHPLPDPTRARGELRLNPLYAATADGARTELRLRFPDEYYEEEYGACRRYLPEAITLERRVVEAVEAGRRSDEVLELVRRRIVLDVPPRYC